MLKNKQAYAYDFSEEDKNQINLIKLKKILQSYNISKNKLELLVI